MLGQSNVPVMGGCLGQDEHPPMKGTHGWEHETGGKSMEKCQDGVHSLEDDYQGANSLGEAQGEVHTATEQAAAHSMEEGACKGVNSLEEGQGDVQMEGKQ